MGECPYPAFKVGSARRADSAAYVVPHGIANTVFYSLVLLQLPVGGEDWAGLRTVFARKASTHFFLTRSYAGVSVCDRLGEVELRRIYIYIYIYVHIYIYIFYFIFGDLTCQHKVGCGFFFAD